MDEANIVIQIFVALGTISVAVLAIWGDWIRHKLAGPRLRLALLDAVGTATHRRDKKKGRYYKLRVWNDRKWSPAKNARVVLKSIFKPAADGTLTPQPLSGPLQLTWQWIVPQFPTLGAGEEICTYANLVQGEQFVLSPYITPNNFVGFLQADKRMVIEVAVVSDTAESVPLFLDLSWNGKWSEDTTEMLTNVVIKETGRIESS
nr:hypothetical protein [Bacteroidota bacterium]